MFLVVSLDILIVFFGIFELGQVSFALFFLFSSCWPTRGHMLEFRTQLDIFRCQGLFKPQVQYSAPTAYTASQLLTLHQHRANNQCNRTRLIKSDPYLETTHSTSLKYGYKIGAFYGRVCVCRLALQSHVRSGLSTWKYQFSYDHWSQATLSSVSTWMGNCASDAWVLLLTLKVG